MTDEHMVDEPHGLTYSPDMTCRLQLQSALEALNHAGALCRDARIAQAAELIDAALCAMLPPEKD